MKECVETASVKVPTGEDKSTHPESTDVLGSKSKTDPKKMKTAPKKIDANEEPFTASEQEAR